MATTIDPTETSQLPISDDQELAKVLAGINQAADTAAEVTADPAVDATATAAPAADDPTVAAPAPVAEPVVSPVAEQLMPDPMTAAPAPVAQVTPAGGDLTNVKSDAINELRPLVDKLNLPAEEKFDTYLLLLRSTDDRSLIEPAHEVAKQITDETRRAQALLDIIKEIDFLSQSQQ